MRLLRKPFLIVFWFFKGIATAPQGRSPSTPSRSSLPPSEGQGDELALVPVPGVTPLPTTTPTDRAAQVQALLEEAWTRGMTTYPQLIGYVRERTGIGCSRRAVARFKQSKGLME